MSRSNTFSSLLKETDFFNTVALHIFEFTLDIFDKGGFHQFRQNSFSFSSRKQQLRLPNVKTLIAAPRGYHCEIITRIQFAFVSENRSSPLKFQGLFNVIICCLLAASLSLKPLSSDSSPQKHQSFLSGRTIYFLTHSLSAYFLSERPYSSLSPDRPSRSLSPVKGVKQWGQSRLNKTLQFFVALDSGVETF